ncbi:nuclear transport factor 2 family protein [Nocardia sp. alder85J]|uniref:nuclear transport factor 2 family protein n=1 Tax=Nocardia sp. alder85J TaxID=2862949 RepID=UPI001CD7FA77|nr:nuclear transport factor 2 family protein [Nocardia sp. alder85J]MCX4091952.1 nuclear transport factor 2 family protein [Nocardia sp. alder85J]
MSNKEDGRMAAGTTDLEQRLRRLEDRAEILDCVARHARGCDRHDAELISSAYHPDASDQHGNATNTGADYADWANAAHAATSQVHTHNITTHSCEIDGDTAHAESYSIVVLLGADGRTAQFVSGRYLDRLERRNGHWRIALRRSTVEVMFTADARVLHSPFFTGQGYPKGTRDTGDLSYQRPLQADSPAPARWGDVPVPDAAAAGQPERR